MPGVYNGLDNFFVESSEQDSIGAGLLVDPLLLRFELHGVA